MEHKVAFVEDLVVSEGQENSRNDQASSTIICVYKRPVQARFPNTSLRSKSKTVSIVLFLELCGADSDFLLETIVTGDKFMILYKKRIYGMAP